MSKKIIRNCMLIIAVCCLILGGIFKMTANNHKGDLVQIKKNIKHLTQGETCFLYLQV